jgi:pyrroloquinoline quinone (PQQ) biosynthesis protein C
LRRHYGLDEAAVSFWAHHAVADARHGDWALSAFGELAHPPEWFEPSLQRAADAWWGFLDEREAAVQAC